MSIVLIVDDDVDIARFIEVNLKLEGFDVLVAHDGEEALAVIAEQLPDAHPSKKVAIDESKRDISLATNPKSSSLPPRQPYPSIPTPPMLSSFIAGNNSNGNASSTQYFVMIGATLLSINSRTCFTTSLSSAGKVSLSS